MPWAAAAAVAGAALSYKGSKDASKAAAEQNDKQIAANQVDPRITAMLFGDGTQRLKPDVTPTWSEPDQYGRQTSTNPQSDYNTNSGLLGQYRDLISKPQSAAMQQFGQAAGDYLTQHTGDMNIMRNAALQQMTGVQAPTSQAPMMMNVPLAEQVKLETPEAIKDGAKMMQSKPITGVGVAGPSQNNLNLNQSFDKMINGAPGANPFLTGAIQKGINQSKNAFDAMQTDSSRNLLEMILPNVRGGAIASGQYGGTRQGIAEGRALGDFGREQQRAISQFGQNNTDAAVAAQAGAYDSDSNRALSAMQGLSANQNAAAIASASNAQAAAIANLEAQTRTYETNARLQQERDMAMLQGGFSQAATQAGLTQQTNLANQNAILGVGQNNQQAQLSTNNANLQSQLSTNGLNSQNFQAGMAGLGGLLGNAYANAGAQDQYGMNQAIQGNSLLAPYLSKSGTPTQLQPVYNNGGAAALSGAMTGLGMYNTFNNTHQQAYGGAIGNTSKPYGSDGYF